MLEVIVCYATHVYSGKVKTHCYRCARTVWYKEPKRDGIKLCPQCHAIEYTLFTQQQKDDNNAANTSTD